MLLTTPAESLQATLPVLMDVLGSEVAVAAMEVSVEFAVRSFLRFRIVSIRVYRIAKSTLGF